VEAISAFDPEVKTGAQCVVKFPVHDPNEEHRSLAPIAGRGQSLSVPEF
jgi:hypothetical protein